MTPIVPAPIPYGVTTNTAAPRPLSVESPFGVVTVTNHAPGFTEASIVTLAVSCVPFVVFRAIRWLYAKQLSDQR